MQRSLAIARLVLSLLLVLCFAQIGRADDFYKNKSIRIIIGADVGGSYGLFAQLVARHLGRFIAGNPSFNIASMPGAGGLVSLNYLGTRAPKDGTTIAVPHVTIAQEYLFDPAAKFDARQFHWIGRISDLSFLGVASRQSGIKSVNDARKREVMAGAPGLANIPAQAPLVLNRIAGTKFKLISGYSGTGPAFLALQRGEVEMVATSLDSVRILHREALEKGEIVPIFAQASKRLADFPNVPTLFEFAHTDLQKAVLRVFSATAEIGRALAVPPGVPEERTRELREAFSHMILDDAFKADAKALGITIAPMSGPDLDAYVSEVINMDPKTKSEVKGFYDKVIFGAK